MGVRARIALAVVTAVTLVEPRCYRRHKKIIRTGRSKPIIDKLVATIAKVVTLPEAKKLFEEQGTEGASSTQAEMDAILRGDTDRLGEIAKRLGEVGSSA
jgi:tripartite-type tricarboxylate transporter receptor subunit TctC